MSVPLPVLVLGLIVGMTYGVLAVGLVIVFRASKIINFAHGQIGAFGATVLGLAVTSWKVPYLVMLPLALGLSALLSALIEMGVVRRLRNAPKLMVMIATLGVSQVLLLLSAVVNGNAAAGSFFPQPPLPSFSVGRLDITPAYFGMLFLTPLLVAGLAIFLRRSKFGLALRAAASNPDAARIDGISPNRMSMLAWVIAGLVSAFTAILVLPTKGFVTTEVLGYGLLLRALVAAVIARMESLPIALGAGVGVGVIEQVLLWNFPNSGAVEIALFAVILVVLLFQRRRESRIEDKGSWATVMPWQPLPASVKSTRTFRSAFGAGVAVLLLIACALPAVLSNKSSFVCVTIMAYTLIGLSVGVVSGLSGQLTLGQFALAAVGAVASFVVSRDTGNFFLSVAVAGLVTALVSVVIGLPALRIRGLLLAVVTLSFALASQSWLLPQHWVLGEGKDPGQPIIGGWRLDTGRSYYYFALACLLVGWVIAANVRRTGLSRLMLAVRDNEDGARAFGVSATGTKLVAFAVAGFLAGMGGAVYGHSLSLISPNAFPVGASVDVVAMAVVGGIGVLAGPLIGALYIVGVPNFIPLDSAGLAATAVGWLVLVLAYPGGLAQALRPVRDRVVARLVTNIAPGEAVPQGPGFAKLVPRQASPSVAEPLLEGDQLAKRFGGVTAVDGVDISVLPGEVLGLIGPNGAGKTTLFEILSGFTRPDSGSVAFAGTDVTKRSPEERARLGLVRSFQDAALFPTLTVQECVQLALEAWRPTALLPSVAGVTRTERAKRHRAAEIVSLLGLADFRNNQIRELSTGTRRITELACILALEPTMLLLDEPAAGVAQRETEVLGSLLLRLRDELDVTLVVIEHDLPFLLGISDRVMAMEGGHVLAVGAPQEVRNNPRVVEAYLGGDLVSIERSGRPARSRSRDGQLAAAAPTN